MGVPVEAIIQFRILFTGAGTGSAISSNPSGLSGSSPGPTPYTGLFFDLPAPFTVDFTAIADPGSVFVGWTSSGTPFGDMTPIGPVANNPQTFTFSNVDSSYTITAEFAIAPCPPITLADSGPFSIFLNELMDPITLIPQGGTGPYTFNIDPNWDGCPGGLCPGATLPPGLTLGGATGIISGTPTAGSPCQYIGIVVTDSLGCTDTLCIQILVAAVIPPACYLLTPCPTEAEQTPITVTNDLSAYVGLGIIQILGKCYRVTVALDCINAVTLNNPVITQFDDCCECNPPTCYELEDCTLETPLLTYSFLAPGPGVDLSQYAGQVIKICDFSSALTLLTDQHVIHSCPPFPPADLGFITGITGSTTGFYYDEVTANILPYVAGAAPLTPYTVGMGACFIPPTGIPSTTTNAPRWSIQFFLGSTAITSIIPYDTYMSLGFLQYMVDNSILDPNVTITLSFGATGLDVQFQTYYNTNEFSFTGVMYINDNSVLPQTVTKDLTGSCICYNVTAIGACCNPTPSVFTGIIDSAWPDCVCCDPPPEEEPEPYVPTIPEIDKHTYKVTESQCDIDANKTFANAMYDKFKTDQYGMESCCPRNFNQIWIQKELSDLSKINC